MLCLCQHTAQNPLPHSEENLSLLHTEQPMHGYQLCMSQCYAKTIKQTSITIFNYTPNSFFHQSFNGWLGSKSAELLLWTRGRKINCFHMKELQGDCKNDISSHASLLSNDEAISLLDKNGRRRKTKKKRFWLCFMTSSLTSGLKLL